MNKKIQIGLLGLGTVGSGVLETLLKKDCGITIKKIADKDTDKIKQYAELSPDIFTIDAYELINDPEISIIVELIGGVNPAFDFIKAAIKNKKHIVTANKELIAKHGKELFSLAEENNVVILYEAAVGGGIPIIMPLRQSLAGNKITQIAGILNGTTNYILTKMEQEGSDFEDVLKEAQRLGYAEADPAGDVKGHDAAYKISILASLAFDKNVDISSVYVEGIDKISLIDIQCADEFGYKIKLIGLVRCDDDETLDIRVHPMLVSKNHPISRIDDVLNAVVIEGEPVSRVMFSGPGAGKFPTASSVIGDILALANEICITDYPLPMMRYDEHHKRKNAVIKDIDETENKYYIRVTTTNVPGVIGDLGLICGNNGINLYSIIQKKVLSDGSAKIVLLTESAKEKSVRKAVEEISKRPTTKTVNNLLRVMD
ncbi:MAG TPA: homoserine dehydrogenase [Candidatus Gastranaerophilales bacterium]|nr:homoserine dehydrogenase [Candidatus Gastranaerophilales bacterium]